MTDPETPVVLDASAAIVLFATGRCPEIVNSWPGQIFVVPEVIAESGFLRNPPANGPREVRVPIEWAQVLASGAVGVLERTETAEFATFVRLAQLVDDGEAAAGAAAIHRGYALVLDDRKARRILAPELALIWSLDLVHSWCRIAELSGQETGTILREIRMRARYQPHDGHPLIAWWHAHVGGL